MQFNQPLYGYGFQNVQFSPYVPQVIGDGEVVSTLYPDGSIQYHFIPNAPQRTQAAGYINNNTYWNPQGVWLVRNSVIPFQQPPAQPFINQQNKPSCQILNGDSDMNFTTQQRSPEFHLKFHNDSSSSTSDLHYFFPTLRGSYWLPKIPACVQAELPSYPQNTCCCTCQVVGTKLSCNQSTSLDNYPTFIYKDSTVSFDNDPMEIDKSGDKKKNTKKKLHNSVVICECEDTVPATANKSVVTYAEKSSDYKTERDNNTQTDSDANIQRKKKASKAKSSLKRREPCSCIIDDSSNCDSYE